VARVRRGRPINGILVLDKPSERSSNAALQSVKRIFRAAKAGHTGSLDPLATGVLPICFGEATKFSQYLLDSDKVYRSTFVLGVTTSSGDSDGDVLEKSDASAITKDRVISALKQFEGTIEQIPSMFSALKHNGQRLYKLARQGKTVERKSRQVTVHNIHLEAFRDATEGEADPEVDVYISCTKGTYVRSIAEDLGKVLGCGAHVVALRRVKAGPFDEAQSVSIQALDSIVREEESSGAVFERLDALLKPVDSALNHLPKACLGEAAAYYFMQGQAVQLPGQAMGDGVAGTTVRLISDAGVFLGLGEMSDDGRVSPKRLIATQ
jgi:tRNA pseudouridine55 synthase